MHVLLEAEQGRSHLCTALLHPPPLRPWPSFVARHARLAACALAVARKMPRPTEYVPPQSTQAAQVTLIARVPSRITPGTDIVVEDVRARGQNRIFRELRFELRDPRARGRRTRARALVQTVASVDALEGKEPPGLEVAYHRAMVAGLALRTSASSALSRVAVLGLGGGALVRFIAHYYHPCELEVAERDAAVVGVAARHFGVHASPPRLCVYTCDALVYARGRAARATEPLDCLLLDVDAPESSPAQPPSVPVEVERLFLCAPGSDLLRADALVELAACVREGGVVIINLLPPSRTPAAALDRFVARAVAPAFAEHAVLSVSGDENLIFIGVVRRFRARLTRSSTAGALRRRRLLREACALVGVGVWTDGRTIL
ncbi:S-adenosyl-L-methionine-dependent methyltransferase [Pavlovales sp. CCMP2436]|nr:S-adenosyl-L-methionine-dependent methyltransferase [Pavlovales sp. CCMP2436]